MPASKLFAVAVEGIFGGALASRAAGAGAGRAAASAAVARVRERYFIVPERGENGDVPEVVLKRVEDVAKVAGWRNNQLAGGMKLYRS